MKRAAQGELRPVRPVHRPDPDAPGGTGFREILASLERIMEKRNDRVFETAYAVRYNAV